LQTLDERGKHTLYLKHFSFQIFELITIKKLQIPGEKEVVF